MDVINESYELYGLYDLEERKEELIHNEIISVFYSKSEKQLKLI